MAQDKPEPTQLDKFKQAARDLECDEDEARFRERLSKIVKPPAGVFGKPRKPVEKPDS